MACLGWILITFGLLSGAHAGPTSPPLRTPKGQAAALYSVSQTMPGLIESIVDHQIDVFGILDEQGEIADILAENH
ncbi:MAG: hypothetical protein AAB425_15155, partial [Bdellovibrionota bacterium]